MPTNLDEVRRAFEQPVTAGTFNGNVADGDAARRGNASDGDGTSVASVAQPDVNAIDSDRTVSPADAVARPGGNVARTGRSAGTGKSRARAAGTVAARPETTSNLERLLFGIHRMLVLKTEVEALALPPAEAKELAISITELNSLYGGKGGVLGPKGYAWFNLIVALGGTYAPMISKVRKEVRDKQVAKNGDVSSGA